MLQNEHTDLKVVKLVHTKSRNLWFELNTELWEPAWAGKKNMIDRQISFLFIFFLLVMLSMAKKKKEKKTKIFSYFLWLCSTAKLCLFSSNYADAATCSNIKCKERQVCLKDLVTHRPRCISCSFKCPRKKLMQVRIFIIFSYFLLFFCCWLIHHFFSYSKFFHMIHLKQKKKKISVCFHLCAHSNGFYFEWCFVFSCIISGTEIGAH